MNDNWVPMQVNRLQLAGCSASLIFMDDIHLGVTLCETPRFMSINTLSTHTSAAWCQSLSGERHAHVQYA